MSDHKFELSRRKALLGLGTVGIASAGAGLGTSAYFSDEESFDGNMMTAGELDLVVNYDSSVDQGSVGTFDISGTNDGGETATFSVTDVKPGDSGEANFCFEITDNPAYMWACGALTASNENGYTEPEPVDENSEGELEEAIEVDVMYCTSGENGGYTDGESITSGTLAEVLDNLDGGIPLDGTGAGGIVDAGSQAPFDGTSNEAGNADVYNPCLCFDFEVPTDVGNEIQGDSLQFDLQFFAEQARHNDGTHNPCLTGRTGDGFAKLRDDFSPTWNARGIIADNDASTGGSDSGLSELDIRDSSDTTLASAGADYGNEETQSFTLDYSDGDTTLTVGGDSVSLSDAPEPSDDDAAITVKTSSSDDTVSVSNVQVNGQTPAGASSVSASGATKYLFLAGGGVSADDTITGEVTFSWNGSTPTNEAMKFRVDA